MNKLLSENFYKNLEGQVIPQLENESTKSILKTIDWENEATNCLSSLKAFFGKLDLDNLKEYGIEQIGVIDICWNEYGSDIEVDFMPGNNFETAFDEGCIMNDSAIDNDAFFSTYFDVEGEKAWDKLGNDYQEIISTFGYIIEEVIEPVVKSPEFKRLPIQSPCHIGFGRFHDEERTKIYTIE